MSQIGFGSPTFPPHTCTLCPSPWTNDTPLVAHSKWRDHRYRTHRIESPPQCYPDCAGVNPAMPQGQPDERTP